MPRDSARCDLGVEGWRLNGRVNHETDLALLHDRIGARRHATAQRGKEKETTPMNESNKKEVAVIKTSEGEMVAEFWPDVAPKTVENFKKLAKPASTTARRFTAIIKGFMIQGGDPLTKDREQRGRGHGRSRLQDQGRVQQEVARTRRAFDGAFAGPEFRRQPVFHLPRERRAFSMANTPPSAN